MPLERITPEGVASAPVFSHVVRAGNHVYLAGQVSQDETGQVVGKGDIVTQANQAFENIKRGLASAGATFDDVVRLTVYVTDARHREAARDARMKYFTAGKLPASTFLVVSGLASPDYLIEMEVTAYVER